jgi:kumamolisin
VATAPNTDSNPLQSKELEVKARELEVRQLEADKSLAATRAPWWRRADPLVLAILAGVVTLLGNMAVERLKSTDDLTLEQTKTRYDLLKGAMATNDVAAASRNINFFIDAGLLKDDDCRIREALERDQPVLPSLSGTAPPTPAGMHSVPEIMSLYNFPPGFDGRGQTIGLIQLGGGIVRADLDQYFKSLNLPTPDVSSVSVDRAGDKPGTTADGEVMINIAIVGAIAPRAQIRVYFAPNKTTGYADALKRAIADNVSVLGSGWGSPESAWSDQDIETINALLERAAKQGITVLVAAGDGGVTDGVRDGRRHVDFPGSSPWVLSVGGTRLKSDSSRITSETVFNSGGSATGGGVSEKFDRPDWQSAVSVPPRDNGKFGRGIPDLVAAADPQFGVPIIVHGNIWQIGGTSGSMPMWAGLIALINQAVGYNVGYLNPRLYREMGPAGLFRTIMSGDNGVSGVKGYTAGKAWSPVAGWGSPDGVKLLSWIRANPDPSLGKKAVTVACAANVRLN